MSLDSFIRSAAQATSSAHRRIPIRWRLAGASALLTLVILCGFAIAVGKLTSDRIRDDFDREVSAAASNLEIDRLAQALDRRPRLAERLFTEGERAFAAGATLPSTARARRSSSTTSAACAAPTSAARLTACVRSALKSSD